MNDFEKEQIIKAVISAVQGDSDITLEQARKLSKIIMERAKQDGVNVVVSVCNSQGRPVLLEVMDGAFLVSPTVATKKSYTSVAVKMSTQKLREEIKAGKSLEGLESENSLIFLGGGEPLIKNGKVVGGLGVSGGTAKQDTFFASFGAEVFKKL